MARFRPGIPNRPLQAYGRFSVNILGEDYSFRKLRLSEVSCILESLAIVYMHFATQENEINISAELVADE